MKELPDKKQFFKQKKESTICSLYEVEKFLCCLKQFFKAKNFVDFFKK